MCQVHFNKKTLWPLFQYLDELFAIEGQYLLHFACSDFTQPKPVVNGFDA